MVTFLYPVPVARAVGVFGEILPDSSLIPAEVGGDDVDCNSGDEVEDMPTFMGVGGSGLVMGVEEEEGVGGVGGSGLVSEDGVAGGSGLVVKEVVGVGGSGCGVSGSGLVDEDGVEGSGLELEEDGVGGSGFVVVGGVSGSGLVGEDLTTGGDGLGGSGFVMGPLAMLDVDDVND